MGPSRSPGDEESLSASIPQGCAGGAKRRSGSGSRRRAGGRTRNATRRRSRSSAGSRRSAPPGRMALGRDRPRRSRHRHPGVGIALRMAHRLDVGPALCRHRYGLPLAAEHLVEFPAGREVERQVGAVSRAPSGRLGVFRPRPGWSAASPDDARAPARGCACRLPPALILRRVRATSASAILRRAQSFERPLPSAALASGSVTIHGRSPIVPLISSVPASAAELAPPAPPARRDRDRAATPA